MSCYKQPKAKAEIEEFLVKLHQLLKSSDFKIFFYSGTLEHKQYGYCGVLEEHPTGLSLIDENTNEELYDTENDIDNK